LTIGFLRYGAGNKAARFAFILLILLPSILISEYTDFRYFREQITFQLGGMLVLAMTGIYASGRKITLEEFKPLLVVAVYPAVTILITIILKSPSLSEINFSLGANNTASGGWGSNQVSTFLGIGILFLGIHMLLYGPIWSFRTDLLILGLLFWRILFTFSRGGLIGALLPLLLALWLVNKYKGKLNQLITTVAVVIPLLIGVFYFANERTNGLLLLRFQGQTYETSTGAKELDLETLSSGRAKIIRTDLEMFLDYPLLGVGLGRSNLLRPSYGYSNQSHIEQSRLLSEHGFFGLIVLLMLIGSMAFGYLSRQGLSRLTILFALFSFLTMAHSATRLALPSFLFGLGFIQLQMDDSIRTRKKTSIPRSFPRI
jgi:hypothetical protein